jgi:hypothetical protein
MKADFVRNLYSIKFWPADVDQISISDYNDAELTKIISAQPLILGLYSEQIQNGPPQPDAPIVQEDTNHESSTDQASVVLPSLSQPSSAVNPSALHTTSAVFQLLSKHFCQISQIPKTLTINM